MRPSLLLTLPMVPWLLAGAGCSSPALGIPESWKRVVLVELFTSQGCSSCPPADALVRELPRLGFGPEKVLPLSFHVDYWDGLGWKDPFASVAFRRRQEWYAQSGKLRDPDGQSGMRGLYTPQMIVNGAVHFSGQRRQAALSEMRRAAGQPSLVTLSAEATITGPVISVSARVAPLAGIDTSDDWRLSVALISRSARTHVMHGENGGEILDEVAIVRWLSDRLPISFASQSRLNATVVKPPDLRWADAQLVAFVQSETTLKVAAALAVELPR